MTAPVSNPNPPQPQPTTLHPSPTAAQARALLHALLLAGISEPPKPLTPTANTTQTTCQPTTPLPRRKPPLSTIPSSASPSRPTILIDASTRILGHGNTITIPSTSHTSGSVSTSTSNPSSTTLTDANLDGGSSSDPNDSAIERGISAAVAAFLKNSSNGGGGGGGGGGKDGGSGSRDHVRSGQQQNGTSGVSGSAGLKVEIRRGICVVGCRNVVNVGACGGGGGGSVAEGGGALGKRKRAGDEGKDEDEDGRIEEDGRRGGKRVNGEVEVGSE